MVLGAGIPEHTPSATSTSIAVHPLVILNISEHYTRIKAESGTDSVAVYGALLGSQDGRMIELLNSFEACLDPECDVPTIKEQLCRVREAQYKEVFPELDLLGWYTTGEFNLTDADVKTHAKFTTLVDAPFLLKLDPSAESNRKLPLVLYESIAGEDERSSIRQVPDSGWQVVSEASERIGVDHVAKSSDAQGADGKNRGTFPSAKQVASHVNAVAMLEAKVQVILAYLKAVDADELPRNEEILREAAKVAQRLPLLPNTALQGHLQQQAKDTKLAVLVTSMVTTASDLKQLSVKLDVLSAEQRIPSSVTGRRVKEFRM